MATPGEVLDDLDSFLDRLSEEEKDSGEQEEERERDDEGFRLYVGDACHQCRVNRCPAMAALLAGDRGCLREILRVNDEDRLSDIRSGNGATLAHVAVRKGDLESLNMLLAKVMSLAKVGDVRGATPLHVCAYHGHEEGLISLLDVGADADQPDLDGATAVHFAAASGHLQCLKILVERGRGNVNARSNSGETPGIAHNVYSTTCRIHSCCFVVYFAAQEGHLACIHWLVEHAQADPQLESTDGMTPLHAAAQTGRLNVTHWLVRFASCPITCRTSDGATPVHFAAAKGRQILLPYHICDSVTGISFHRACSHTRMAAPSFSCNRTGTR